MHVGAIINCLLKIIQTGRLVTQFIAHRRFTGDSLTLKLRHVSTINDTFSCTLPSLKPSDSTDKQIGQAAT
jgi:hypothetical protein